VSDVLGGSHVMCDEKTYDKRRYIVGLSEGPLDLPPGNCTPLESNALFLNGGMLVCFFVYSLKRASCRKLNMLIYLLPSIATVCYINFYHPENWLEK